MHVALFQCVNTAGHIVFSHMHVALFQCVNTAGHIVFPHMHVALFQCVNTVGTAMILYRVNISLITRVYKVCPIFLYYIEILLFHECCRRHYRVCMDIYHYSMGDYTICPIVLYHMNIHHYSMRDYTVCTIVLYHMDIYHYSMRDYTVCPIVDITWTYITIR